MPFNSAVSNVIFWNRVHHPWFEPSSIPDSTSQANISSNCYTKNLTLFFKHNLGICCNTTKTYFVLALFLIYMVSRHNKALHYSLWNFIYCKTITSCIVHWHTYLLQLFQFSESSKNLLLYISWKYNWMNWRKGVSFQPNLIKV